MAENLIFDQTIRVIVLTVIAFFVALLVTPLWFRFLKKNQVRKQIRGSNQAPIFNRLHKSKEGTPTAGGIIIWSTVIGLALVFGILSMVLDGFWEYLSFINRAETYLPLAALFIAAVIGLLDDYLGVMKIGGSNGGGLKVRFKLIFPHCQMLVPNSQLIVVLHVNHHIGSR